MIMVYGSIILLFQKNETKKYIPINCFLLIAYDNFEIFKHVLLE